jgi:ADP-ribosylation factor GTPase-activating protein 2/3
LCLDCSATHRNMGVHTTFVRSLDLDEWTQRQIDAMRLGGNANAKTFFRQHGLTDMHGKIEKKYSSKAAIAYRAELAKLVEAEAVKRGEGTGEAVASAGSLLENLALQSQQEQDAEAKAKLAAAKVTASQQAQPKMQLASQREGAKGKLVVTPPNSGGLQLRKPTTKTSSAMMLKKKPSGGGLGVKLGASKLVMKQPSGGADANIDSFEDMDAAQQKQLEEEEKARAAAAAKAAMEAAKPKPAPVPAPAPAQAQPKFEKKSSMEEGVSRLQAMNNDFFSGV